jgi:hypothetical protein
LGNPGTVAVYYLPDQDFIANGNYFCLHVCNEKVIEIVNPRLLARVSLII